MAARKINRTSAIERWTWKQAEEALGKNIVNRNFHDLDLDKYVRDMSKGLWGLCSAPIVFDVDGNLIDGQHRLTAQVKTKTTQEWLVLRHVPVVEQEHIDIGIPRTLADQLKIRGYASVTVLASVARWAYLLNEGKANDGRYKPSTDEVRDMILHHEDLVHSARIALNTRNNQFFNKVMGPTPLGAAHWWIAQTNDHQEADLFFERFGHLNREPDGSSIFALWRRMSSARSDTQSIQTRLQIALIIRAWNLDVERTFVHNLPIKTRGGVFVLPEVAKRTESQEDSFGPVTTAEEGLEREHTEMDQGEAD